MRIHNLVQDLVVQKVDELFADAAELPAPGLDRDPANKLDVVCYVLNRTPPMYAVSGRGIAHNESAEYQGKVQKLADITRLVREGMESVSKRQRDREQVEIGPTEAGPYFNFPSIIGRVFDGANFGPVHDVVIGLYERGELVKVIDPNWQNPYQLVLNTAGTYLFWPHPQTANLGELERTVQFELRVDSPLYEPLRYFFSVASRADPDFIDFVNTTASMRLKDLYLFPRD